MRSCSCNAVFYLMKDIFEVTVDYLDGIQLPKMTLGAYF